jgi:hypothetical protein
MPNNEEQNNPGTSEQSNVNPIPIYATIAPPAEIRMTFHVEMFICSKYVFKF